MPDGFSVQVDELDKAADESLKPVADYLWEVAKQVKRSSVDGGGLAETFTEAYAQYTDEVGDRQAEGCARIDDTADALRDIADLYRRADGQD
jgi:hypothetical protein